MRAEKFYKSFTCLTFCQNEAKLLLLGDKKTLIVWQKHPSYDSDN
jgi:hypothetical protein